MSAAAHTTEPDGWLYELDTAPAPDLDQHDTDAEIYVPAPRSEVTR